MHILVSDKPERRIAIASEEYALILKAVNHPAANKKPYCAIELVLKKALESQGFIKLTESEIYGFIGLIEVDRLIFVAVITGKTKVAAPVPGETVNKIFAADFFCLNDPTWDFLPLDSSGYPVVPSVDDVPGSSSSSNSDFQQINNTLPKHPCFELRKLLSSGSFYYSSDFDLTSTLQHRGYGAHSLSVDNYEEEYMWNSFMMQEIVTYRDRLDINTRKVLDDQGFLTTVIRGFAETFITYVKKTKIALTVISKQSWKRAGTRYNARGVDDESNAANFVETELIMYSTNYCFAFTEIRGSIPVFWEQDTSLLNPKVQITRSMEATQPVFDRHFQNSIEKYGPVHVINLLSTKSSEIELSRRYRDHIQKSNNLKLNDDIFYTAFDFHKETAQQGFAAVSKLIPGIMDALLMSGYYAYDIKGKKIISEQHGIFRTNCLDCLDRTNLAQQVVSLAVFRIFLQDFNFITENTFIDDDDFVLKHNSLWADNGDQISQIYTGTNALKSSFSRKGKMSFAGALSDATKSVSRMYINNFMDKGKQQNIDTLLGRLPHQEAVQLYDPMNDFVTSKLEDLSSTFTSYSSINLFIGSFNVNGTSKKADLSKWLFPIGDKFKPDIVVLGLQEVIELTAGSILNADYTKGSFWENMVSDCLNQFDEKYLLLRVEQMSSMLILLFVKSDKTKCVKQVEGATKKTGFGGMAGNKGAVAIRFKYEETSFCFVNMHLSAGVTNVDERRNDYHSISRGISFTRSNTIKNHDSIIWLGDSNYRINLSNEAVRRELATKSEGYIGRLLRSDQLSQEMKSGAILSGFKEPDINFRPTYKYDNGTDRYDTSEKARTPSWTDRIVYKGDNLLPLAYDAAPLLISDHRPVYGAYRAKVKNINTDEKLKLTKRLFDEYKQNHPNETSSLSSQLINLDIDNNIKNDIFNPKAVESGVSLLDIDNLGKGDGRRSPPGILSSSNSSSLQSLSSSLLQPQKNSLKETENAPLANTNSSSMGITTSNRTKPAIRPPPPPAFRNIPSNSSNTNNNNSANTEIRSRPVPPPVSKEEKPVHSSPIINASTPTPATTSSTSSPSGSRVVSPPPGFSPTILTPKNTNANINISSHPLSTTPSVNSTNSNVTASIVDSSSIPVTAPVSADSSKSTSAEKSLDSWQPLTPN